MTALIEEVGNPAFNLNDAEPIGDAHAFNAEFAPTPDFTRIDRAILPKLDGVRKAGDAPSAITAEDLAFEAALQRVHVESPLPRSSEEIKLTEEVVQSDFLGDYVEDYKPASTLNELEQQVYAAKSRQANAIEATDDIIRYYTKTNFPNDVGYFIFKDVRVFIIGRHASHVPTDKQNMNFELRKL